MDQDLSSLLERFWKQEDTYPTTSSPLTENKVECENYFISTHRCNCYVDDVLAGVDTIDHAKLLKTELVGLLKAGGFPLSKSTANHPQLLFDVPKDLLAPSPHRTWQQSDALQMLGISWRPADDAFYFQFSHSHLTGTIKKRKALSLIAKLYDPLGWIASVTVSFKIFMQTLWYTGLQWDDVLPLLL